MTATDELRAMLDKRGVKWLPIAWNPKRETFYHAANGVGFCADEYTDGVRIYTDATITTEQAVEATLGRGECHDIGYRMDSTRFKCSQCGWDGWVRHAKDGRDYKPLWCPLCGAKVVAE